MLKQLCIRLIVEIIILIQITKQRYYLWHSQQQFKMATSLESLFKNNMYRSLQHRQIYMNNQTRSNRLSYSIINSPTLNSSAPNPVNPQVKNNNISYKYERVGNMFKLVQLKSVNSDPRQQVINEGDKLQKINEAIHDLTNRVISLEFQQAKFPGFQRKLNQKNNMCSQFQNKYNYLSTKMNSVTRQVSQLRQSLEQIQEQGHCNHQTFLQISKMMNELKQQTIRIPEFNETKYNQLQQTFKNEMSRQIQQIRNQLNEYSSMKIKNINRLQSKTLTLKTPTIQFKKKTLKLKYRQTYQHEQSIYSVNQTNYIIDKEGRLLDSSGYILLDANNNQIKLNEAHLKKLSDFGILY